MRPVNFKRVTIQTLFGLVIAGTATLFLLSLRSDSRIENNSIQIQHVAKEVCKDTASLLSRTNTRVVCQQGYIETQELQSGNVLILCRCRDPFECLDEKKEHQATP